jgi:hypothetical protein
MPYADPSPLYSETTWAEQARSIVLKIALILILARLFQAVLSYYADVSICYLPLKIVSHQDRIEQGIKDMKLIYRPGRYNNNPSSGAHYVHDKKNVVYVLKLDPKNCCKVYNRGRWRTEGSGRITFYTTLIGKQSHIVDAGEMPVYHRSWGDYERRFRIASTVCGEYFDE